MSTPRRRIEICQMIIDNLEKDAAKLDKTPFTPSGMGKVLGELMADVQALAKVIKQDIEFQHNDFSGTLP
jgi:hypothetical protein